MQPYVLYNDQVVPADQLLFTPGQLGLLSGWGVFTTLRIYRGVPFAWERHWARLMRDAALIHVELPGSSQTVRAGLLELIERNQSPDAKMRLCVFRSRGGVWEGPGSGNASDLIAFSIEVTDWAETVSLGVREQGRHAASAFAGTKTLSWAHNLTMLEEAQQEGYDEVVLLNERGEVAECTSANIFAVQAGVTHTPPLSSGPLPGITREVMLEELGPCGCRVEEKVLSLDDLKGADEVFITSSTRELLPVRSISGRALKASLAGPWPEMEKLRAGLREYVERYTAEQTA